MCQFDQLVESRRRWIQEVLEPWCRKAPRADLQRAELEWTDIAGKVDPQTTLWTWAWSRFPALIGEGIARLDETWPVTLTLRNGSSHTGYPDARQSERGQLVLVGKTDAGDPVTLGPFSIDEITGVVRA